MATSFTKQAELPEEKQKGIIFKYFVGAIWLVSLVNTIQNLYFSFTLPGSAGEDYASYNAGNFSFLVIFGLIWWGHRWYPHLMRHIFISLLIIGLMLFFKLEDLGGLLVVLTLPIIMAAFLIKPVYSFVYYLLIAGLYVLRVWVEGFSVLNNEELLPFVGLISLIVFAVVAWLIAQSLDQALEEARALNRELDQRVQLRTKELAAALERERTTAIRNTTILESIADGVLVFDADQRVIIANPAANRLAGRDLISSRLSDFLATIEDKVRDLLADWVRGHQPAGQTNLKFEWDRRTISANVARVLLPTLGEQPVGAGSVMVLRDFTREAQLERAKDLFLGMVSHELRTPMSAIQGYVQILLQTEKEALSATGFEHLQTIEVSIKQLLKLANDLIDLSRLETGEIDLYRQWIDITGVINQAAKIVQQQFTSRNLTLEVQVAGTLPKLYLDRNRIMQVLLNLLSNAYKYTSEGGATVRVSQRDEWVYISVQDTGVGIKDTDQSNLFNRFFRAGDRVVQKAGGTGLGLNISKGLVELHGGTLTFQSQYGLGTTFTVALPTVGVVDEDETNGSERLDSDTYRVQKQAV